MKEILKKYPVLQGIVTDFIEPNEKYAHFLGSKVKVLFEAALLTDKTIPIVFIPSYVQTIAEYLELPSIMHNKSDEEWRQFKGMISSTEHGANIELKILLHNTKLHTALIGSVCQCIDDEMLAFDDSGKLLIERNRIFSAVNSTRNHQADYMSWSKQKRLHFVENDVTKFVYNFCIRYILSRQLPVE